MKRGGRCNLVTARARMLRTRKMGLPVSASQQLPTKAELRAQAADVTRPALQGTRHNCAAWPATATGRDGSADLTWEPGRSARHDRQRTGRVMIRATFAEPIEALAGWQNTDHFEIFATRCHILADLVDAGECDFHDGVDLLQAEAEANDLPELFAALADPGETGQDVVQEIMASAFRAREKPDVEIRVVTRSRSRLRRVLNLLRLSQRTSRAQASCRACMRPGCANTKRTARQR
jgi:hypothetical protein